MAFNPFHAFRKHQKVVFAALTIICMLTFVLASGVKGGGDFFSALQGMIGSQAHRIEVATLYGEKLYRDDIIQLREQRRQANRYMVQRILRAHGKILSEVAEGIKNKVFDERATGELQNLFIYRQLALGSGYGVQEYQLRLPQYLLQLELLREDLKAAKKTAEAEKIQELRAALHQEAWLVQHPKDELYPTHDLYFGGSTSLEGLLDFMIWRHEADRLGIQLTTDDLNGLLEHETVGYLTKDEVLALENEMWGAQRRTTSLALVKALGDEFRVRMAQAALVGYDPGGFSQVPSATTPYELWQYYRKNRTEANVKLLTIPVDKFVNKVKEEPSDEALRTLFDEYKNQEPAPNKNTPGFKQPRRVKVEWVEASPDSPSYRKSAHNSLLSLVAATAGNPALATALTLSFISEYNSLKWVHGQIAPWTEPNFASSFYTHASLNRPEDVAAMVGAAAMPESTYWGLIGQQSAAVARGIKDKDLAAAIDQERKNRLLLSSEIVSAGLGLSPLSVPGLWQYADKQEHFVPPAALKSQLIRKFEDNMARELVASTLDDFKKKLQGQKNNKEEIEKLVKTEVEKHSWKYGITKEFHDQYDIAAGLGPLKEAYLRTYRTNDPKGKQFAARLIFDQGTGQPKPYNPRELFDEKGTFLYWKTADEAAGTLSFDQAKAKVVQAWRFREARKLAKKEADEIAKKAKGDPLPILTEAGKRLGKDPIEIKAIARLKQVITPRAGFGNQYGPYKVDEDIIEYPKADFVDRVMELKKPGEVEVIADQPEAHYYVVALTQRLEPSVSDFHKDTGATLFQKNYLLSQFEQEIRKDYRQSLLNVLRDQANYWINPETKDQLEEKGTSYQD